MVMTAFLIPGDLELPTGGYGYDRRTMAFLGALGVAVRHVALPGSYPSPTPADLAETAALVAGLPANTVLLIDGLAYGAMPASLIQSFARPVVALCHHPLCLEAGLSPERQASLASSETAALALSQAVIVTSPATRALLVRDFGVPSARISVAVPGTDPAPRAEGTGHPLQLFAVGSIVPRKGYDVLIDALATIPEPNWRLVIAGAEDRNPATVAALREQIADTGLAARIRLAGAVDTPTLSALYARTDIFVMPSLFEGYGMAIAEAMARGLPIVCTTGGAAADTAPEAAALKVPPGDATALAAALRQVIAEPERRRAMAKAAWVASLDLPRWEDTARIVAGVIKKVAP